MTRIVSGGQTGVDRAALDVALDLGLECGGWCPGDRWAEDGVIAERYPLRATPSRDPAQRTEWNVRDSDATLIIAPLPLSGGTALTRHLAKRLGRACLVLEPERRDAGESGRRWLADRAPAVLNIAGPRESSCPGVYDTAVVLLRELLGNLRD